MKISRTFISCSCLFLILTGGAFASPEARKFLAYESSGNDCESEVAALDSYALELQNEPQLKAYVIAYGGRRGTARHEMRVRRARIERYLVTRRGIDPKRIMVVNGGSRHKQSIELWLVPEGEEMPKAMPTVLPKDVRYRKAKYSFDCSTFF